MHPSVMRYVQSEVQTHCLSELSVLEVGALNVNGTVRGLFAGPYVASDMRAGRGVDIVLNAHDLSFDEQFDMVVCCEMLEHDELPWVSLAAMRRAVKPQGHLLLTARGYDERGCFPVHGYPDDLWRFSVQGVEALLRFTGWKPITVVRDPEAPGVFAHAFA